VATFPLPGYAGAVDLHHGSVSGGSDLFAPIGTRIVSIVDGVVAYATSDSLGGNAVQIDGADGLTYYYAHMRDTPLVRAGQRVLSGQDLGVVGTTGNAAGTPPHLHIGIGHGIISGAGPSGGTGQGFDAVTYLRGLVGGRTIPGPGAPGMPEPGRPSGPASAPIPTPGSPAQALDDTKSGIANLSDLAKSFANSLGGIADAIGSLPLSIITTIKGSAATLAWLGQVNIWRRAGLTLLGAMFVLVGIVLFALSLREVQGAVRAAASVA